MSPDELARERRFGRIAAVAAVVSGIALYGGILWAQLAYSDAPDNKADRLRYFDRHAGEILASAVIQAVGMLLLAVVALHLYRAVKARKPDEPLVVAVMGVYGPVGMALITVAQAVALTIIAGDFADRPSQTLAAAEDALKDPALLIPRYLGISAALALAFWLVKGSLDAMRVGLLTRFMGVFGIALGPAFVLQFGSLILPLWLIALGALFAGRWPRRPPTRVGVRRGVARGRARRSAGPPLPTLPRAGGGRPQRRGRPRRPGCAARRPAARPARPRIGWRRMGAPKAFLATGLALAAVGLAACGDAKLDTDRAESAIRSGITRQTGVKIDTVRCPEDVEAQRGETFRCVARASNGQRARVEVRQRDDEGSVSWRLIGQRAATKGNLRASRSIGDGPGRRSTRGRHVRKAERPSTVRRSRAIHRPQQLVIWNLVPVAHQNPQGTAWW